jgi:hypothetical protein
MRLFLLLKEQKRMNLMVDRASKQEGFLGVESSRDKDGLGITVLLGFFRCYKKLERK